MWTKALLIFNGRGIKTDAIQMGSGSLLLSMSDLMELLIKKLMNREEGRRYRAVLTDALKLHWAGRMQKAMTIGGYTTGFTSVTLVPWQESRPVNWYFAGGGQEGGADSRQCQEDC